MTNPSDFCSEISVQARTAIVLWIILKLSPARNRCGWWTNWLQVNSGGGGEGNSELRPWNTQTPHIHRQGGELDQRVRKREKRGKRRVRETADLVKFCLLLLISYTVFEAFLLNSFLLNYFQGLCWMCFKQMYVIMLQRCVYMHAPQWPEMQLSFFSAH